MKSKAQIVREYMNANPDATIDEIAKKCKVTKQYVYQVRSDERKKAIKRHINTHGDSLSAIYKISKLKERLGKPKLRMQASFDREPPTIMMEEPKADPVNHPSHYKTGGIETIDFIEAKELGYHLGNVIKYVTRAKHKGNELEDLKKAQWYLERAIMKLHI